MTWFDYLKRWEEDEFVKSRSTRLNVQGKIVYLLDQHGCSYLLHD